MQFCGIRYEGVADVAERREKEIKAGANKAVHAVQPCVTQTAGGFQKIGRMSEARQSSAISAV
jgi:hypothetical protein